MVQSLKDYKFRKNLNYILRIVLTFLIELQEMLPTVLGGLIITRGDRRRLAKKMNFAFDDDVVLL